MSDGDSEFDPEAKDQREIGREMVDQSTGLGSVAAHLYRGEVERAVSWRGRLDTTTNWAVTVMSAIVAYAFSGDVSHAIILAGVLMGTAFLFIEGRRFQQYDIWRSGSACCRRTSSPTCSISPPASSGGRGAGN